jgi:hypothetical protein
MRLFSIAMGFVIALGFTSSAVAKCGCECVDGHMKGFCDDGGGRVPNCHNFTCARTDDRGSPVASKANTGRIICRTQMIHQNDGTIRWGRVCN